MSNQQNSFKKWLIKTFFTTPTFAILLSSILLFAGISSYNSMIKEALPDLKLPLAEITTEYYGAAPAIIEKEVTAKLEEELKDLSNVKRYYSSSEDSFSDILVEFNSDADIESSMQRLREKINTGSAELPKGSKSPHIRRSSIRHSPILIMMLHGNVAAGALKECAEELKTELSRIQGVNKVRLDGENKKQVYIRLKQNLLKTYTISSADIIDLLSAHTFDQPLGNYKGSENPFTIISENSFHSLTELAELPVKKFPDNKILRLKDIADIQATPAREEAYSYFSKDGSDYTRGTSISIFKASGQDTVKLVETALKRVAALQKNWPETLSLSVISNNARVIEEELEKTFDSAWQSFIIVFVVLFFLLSWKEAAIAACAIPLTFLSSIFILHLFDITFNLLVIIGMILALGLLVDDFILVMEGMHEGIFILRLPFSGAVLRTLKHYAIPSLSGTMTTVITFLPLALIGGIDGKFLRAIPATAAICLLASYLLSIFAAIPLSKFLLHRKEKKVTTSRIDKITARAERSLSSWLQSHVTSSPAKLWRTVFVALILIIFSITLALDIPSVLYPKGDGRNMGITIELPIESRISDTDILARKLGKVIQKKDYLSSILLTSGVRDFIYEGSYLDGLTSPARENYIGLTILFKPLNQRKQEAYKYIPELEGELRQVLEETAGSNMTITAETGAANNQERVQIDLSGTDFTRLRKNADEIIQQLRLLPELYNVRETSGQSRTQATVIPDREMLEFYKITEEDFNRQLQLSLSDYKAGKLRQQDNKKDLDIHLQTSWSEQDRKRKSPQSWKEWQSIHILTPNNSWIPLSLLAELRFSASPPALTHKNGKNTLTILAKSTITSFEEITSKVEPILKQAAKSWEHGYTYRWAGEVEQADETYGNSNKAFFFAVLGVFAILVLQFGSFLQPFIILCTVIFGLCGVSMGFSLTATDFSFPALIGIIALAGINVNDGIVLIDTMNRLHKQEGIGKYRAAADGAAERLRPIVSTTLTTIAGLIPLAASDPSWRPLCNAIIFGETISTLTALFIIPALFCLLTRRKDTEPETL